MSVAVGPDQERARDPIDEMCLYACADLSGAIWLIRAKIVEGKRVGGDTQVTVYH